MNKETIRKEVGLRFAEALKSMRVSVPMLSERLSISEPMLYKMKAGTSATSFEVLQELIKIDPTINLNYIITGDGILILEDKFKDEKLELLSRAEEKIKLLEDNIKYKDKHIERIERLVKKALKRTSILANWQKNGEPQTDFQRLDGTRIQVKEILDILQEEKED